MCGSSDETDVPEVQGQRGDLSATVRQEVELQGDRQDYSQLGGWWGAPG